MPYIAKETREVMIKPETPGELNYAITKLCVEYLGADVSYTRINEIVGVLECAKLELYRRVAAEYEDQKCSENGDVF